VPGSPPPSAPEGYGITVDVLRRMAVDLDWTDSS
jgi:hypothetical protein